MLLIWITFALTLFGAEYQCEFRESDAWNTDMIICYPTDNMSASSQGVMRFWREEPEGTIGDPPFRLCHGVERVLTRWPTRPTTAQLQLDTFFPHPNPEQVAQGYAPSSRPGMPAFLSDDCLDWAYRRQEED